MLRCPHSIEARRHLVAAVAGKGGGDERRRKTRHATVDNTRIKVGIIRQNHKNLIRRTELEIKGTRLLDEHQDAKVLFAGDSGRSVCCWRGMSRRRTRPTAHAACQNKMKLKSLKINVLPCNHSQGMRWVQPPGGGGAALDAGARVLYEKKRLVDALYFRIILLFEENTNKSRQNKFKMQHDPCPALPLLH